MAIFKCPQITTDQRLELTLQEAEIVYDINLKKYFGGDNFRVGGFPLGEGSEPKVEVRAISALEIQQKFLVLNSISYQPNLTKFHFINGTTQIIDIDYEINSESIVSWDGLSLDGFIEQGDIVRIEYF